MKAPKIIDMQTLRIFLTTAEDCNMSLAAARLGITQSAVSQAIGQLEEQFGTQLLDRQRRPLTLTKAGVALSERGASLLNAALNLKGAVLEASRGARPDIRLGLVDSFATTCGTSVAKKMLDRISQLTLHTGLSFELSDALLERKFDLIISTDSLKDVDGLVRIRLFSESFVVITALDFKDEIGTVRDLAKLSERAPIIRYKHQSHLGRQTERILRFADVSVPKGLEVDTADTLTSLVAGGVGWAITTPLCLLQAQGYAKRVRIHFLEPAESRSFYLLARENEYQRLLQDTFEIARNVLADECMHKLASLHPKLPGCVQLGQWSTGGARQHLVQA